MEYPFPTSPTVNFDEVIAIGLTGVLARTKANDAWKSLSSAVITAVADQPNALIAYLGAGRFVSGATDVDAQPVIGTGLTLRQPNATLLVQGRYYLVNQAEPSPYLVISGVLAGESGGVEVFAGINAATNALYTQGSWQFDAYPSTDEDLATVRGLIHLGRAVTNSTSVTGFTPSTRANAGIILPPGTGSGSGGEVSGDYVTNADFTAYQLEVTALINELQSQIDELKAPTSGSVPAASKTGQYAHNQAVLVTQSGEQYSPNVDEFEGAFVMRQVFGDGTAGTVTRIGPSTMVPTDRGWTP